MSRKEDEERRGRNIEELMDWAKDPDSPVDPMPYTGKRAVQSLYDWNLINGLKGKKGNSMYHPELGQYIAEEYSKSAKNLHYFYRYDSRFPEPHAVWTWEKKYPEFAELMKHAREIKAHHIDLEIQEIADNVEVEDKFGSARVSKAKLQIGVRDRVAKRFNRAVYGDVQEVNVNANLTFTQLVQQMRDATTELSYSDRVSAGAIKSTPADNREQSEGSGLVPGELVGGTAVGNAERDLVERKR